MKKDATFFSKQLRKLMVEKNLNQSELKNETGIAQTVISRWVRGESVPEFSSVEKLAKIFNLPIEYFIKDYKAEDNKKLIQIEEEKLKTLKEILDIQKELLKIAKVKK